MVSTENEAFLPSREVNLLLAETVSGYTTVSHRTSFPVICETDRGFCLAAFTFCCAKRDIEAGKIERPFSWITADLINGRPSAGYDCRENDFTDAPFSEMYDIRGKRDVSSTYYDKAFAVLDRVRKKLITEGRLCENDYREYLDRILAATPAAYRKFYKDLSI